MGSSRGDGETLRALERSLVQHASDLAVFLVFDRPERVSERPGLARTYFAERCASDAELSGMVDAFRSIGAYVELFEGEHPLFDALATERLQKIPRRLKVVYNGIESCVAPGGFAPGRKALLPAVADSYGLACTNSNAYGCAVGRHKYHYLTLLSALGVRTPPVWHYRPGHGWAAGREPEPGLRVIVKSTYESWSVGVTEASVFEVDESCNERVSAIADEIGQPVTVQEFVPGVEVNVPVFACPDRVVTPPVESVLAKAPGDPQAIVTIDDNLTHSDLTYRAFRAPPAVIAAIRESASAAFDALALESFARIDFRVDDDGLPWLTDVGVEPGVAPEGSACVSAGELGLDHPSFLRTVVAASLASRDLIP